MMNQPELGNTISETRRQKSLTQKELADLCNIDIRTIQRIESGEVVPRKSTLKLISKILDTELLIPRESGKSQENGFLNKILLISFISGIVYLFNWFLFSPIAPKNEILISLGLVFALVNVLSGVLYNYGFYELGKHYQNKWMKIAALVCMITIPIFFITILLSDSISFMVHFKKLVLIVSGINGIIFGIGFLKIRSQLVVWYKIAGVIQILISPFFLLPIPSVNLVGCWLAIPFLVCINFILFCEYQNTKADSF